MSTWIALKFLILGCYIPVVLWPFWCAMSNASGWYKCYHYTWKYPLWSWYCIQILDMMQRISRLSYNCMVLNCMGPPALHIVEFLLCIPALSLMTVWEVCPCINDVDEPILCPIGLKHYRLDPLKKHVAVIFGSAFDVPGVRHDIHVHRLAALSPRDGMDGGKVGLTLLHVLTSCPHPVADLPILAGSFILSANNGASSWCFEGFPVLSSTSSLP